MYDRAWDTLLIMLSNGVLALQGLLLNSTIYPYSSAITLLSASICRNPVAGRDKLTGQRWWGCEQGVIASTGITTRQLANTQRWSQITFMARDNLRDTNWIVAADGGQLIYPLRGEILGDPLPAALAGAALIFVDEVSGIIFVALATKAAIYDPRTGLIATTQDYPAGVIDTVEPTAMRMCNQILYVQINSKVNSKSLYFINITNVSSVPQQAWSAFNSGYAGFGFYCENLWVWAIDEFSVLRLFDTKNGTIISTTTLQNGDGDLYLDSSRNLLIVNSYEYYLYDRWQLTLVNQLPSTPWDPQSNPVGTGFTIDERIGRMYVGGGNSGATWYIDYNTTSLSEWAILLPASECANVASLAFDQRAGVLHIACGVSGSMFAMSSNFACQSGSEWTGAACTACQVGRARGVVSFESSSRFIPQCQTCEQGFIAPYEGAAQCTACSPGKVQIDPLTQVCEPCGAGTVQNKSAQIACVPCAPGKYSNTVGAVECLACSSGSYSGNFSADVCSPCAAGRFAIPNVINPTSGSSACSQCSPGSIAATIGLTSCSACIPGRFAALNGSSDCEVCARGSASNVTGLGTHCPVCEMGYEAPRFGQTACSACQFGYTSAVDGCVQCAPSTYTPQAGSPCVSCTSPDQVGLQCSSGLAFVESGYWAYRVPDNATGMTRFVTTACPVNFCSGSPLQQVIQSNASMSNTTFIELCEWPRLSSVTNVMCGECEEGYLAWGDECISCTGTNTLIIFGLIILCFLLVFFLYATSTSSAGAISIGIFFVQVAQLQIRALHSHMEWMGFVNLGAHSVRVCFAPLSPIQQTLLTCSTPLLLCGTLATMGGFHRIVLLVMQKARQRIHLTFPIARYTGTAVAILLFSYTSVASGVMNAIHCIDVGEDRVVFAMPSVNCRSEEYKQALPYFIATIVVFVAGLPLALLVVLFINRQRVLRTLVQVSSSEVNEADASPAAVVMSASDVAFDLRFGPAYRMYTAQSAGIWQSLILLRRLAFVLVSVLLNGSSDTTLQFTLFGVLSFSGLLLHLFVKPFRSERLNRLETMASMCLTYLAPVLVISRPPHMSVISQVLINLLILVPAAIIFGVVAQDLLTKCRARYSLRAKSNNSRRLSNPAREDLLPAVDDEMPNYQATAATALTMTAASVVDPRRSSFIRSESSPASPSLSRDDYVSIDEDQNALLDDEVQSCN